MSKDPSKKKISLFGSQLSTIISVSLVLTIIGFILIATTLTHGADNTLRQRVGMVVRMNDSATAQDIARMSDFLESRPFVASLHFSSAQEVYNEEMEYNGELLNALGSNPYSSEFDIYLNNDYVNSDSINSIVSQLETIDCIDSAYTSTEVVDSINYLISKLTLYLSIFGVVMIVISVVLIFNTVNLVIYSRRFIIHTMKLVGARPSFIRRPFILSSMRLGALAGVVASAVICALHFYASTIDMEYLFFPGWLYTVILCGVLTVVGILFCSLAALFATGRFIRYSYDSLYLK